jgi:hypothetical protein
MSSVKNRKSRPSLSGEPGGSGGAVGRVDAFSIFPSTSLFYPISGGLSSALWHHGGHVVCLTSLGGAPSPDPRAPLSSFGRVVLAASFMVKYGLVGGGSSAHPPNRVRSVRGMGVYR